MRLDCFWDTVLNLKQKLDDKETFFNHSIFTLLFCFA